MKLKLLRPICFGGGVAVEGDEIETTEQHGRELIQKAMPLTVLSITLLDSRAQSKRRRKRRNNAFS